MLKINVTDLIKVLTIDESGVCDDGTGRAWVRCSALSFFDDEENYISLVAFGYTADMILDNHTGENMRRAMVTGALEVVENFEIVKVDFNGVKKSIKVPKINYKLIVDSLRFVDKNNWGETNGEAVSITDDDNDEPLDLTSGNHKEVAATTGDVKYVDDDDATHRSLSRERNNYNSKSARAKSGGRRIKRVVPE